MKSPYFTLEADIKVSKGLVYKTQNLELDLVISQKSTFLSKIFYLGKSETEDIASNMFLRLIAEIESQYKKKVDFMDEEKEIKDEIKEREEEQARLYRGEL